MDEALLRLLPLPLAHLYRRAHSAPTHQERHTSAIYLWEAAIKLLGSVAVVEYVAREAMDSAVRKRLANLARPALRHWSEFIRLLMPPLADQGDPHFARIRTLLAQPLAKLPRAAELHAAFREQEEKPGKSPERAPLESLLTEFIAYRQRALGHGALVQQPAEFHARMSRWLTEAATEVLGRLDVLAGRRLVYLTRLRVASDVLQSLDRFELIGEEPAPLRPLTFSEDETGAPPRPDRLYLIVPADVPAAPRVLRVPGLLPLDPLVRYDPETGAVFFFNRSRGGRLPEYLSYPKGRFASLPHPDEDDVPLLAPFLEIRPTKAGPAAEPAIPERLGAASRSEPLTGEAPPPKAADQGGPPQPEPSEPRTQEWMPPEVEPASSDTDTAEEADAARRPRRLGAFEIREELLRGDQGTLFRGWQPMLERPVALKCLPAALAEDSQAKARFLREVHILGQVRHPNLAAVYDSGVEDGSLFYAREWVEGASLEEVQRRLQAGGCPPEDVDLRAFQQALSDASGVIPPANLADMAGRPRFPRLAELVRQIAGALHALHQAGVVHRQVTPANILLTADGMRAVLIGLSIAMEGVHDGALTREDFVGTPRYVSPEQVMGGVYRLDGRSDVYCLGIVFWEMLALHSMYEDMEVGPLLQQVQFADPPPLRRVNPKVPADLEMICARCLQKRREDRYPSAQALAEALQWFLAGEPIRARPCGARERLLAWLRRRWRKSQDVTALPAAEPLRPKPPTEPRPVPPPEPESRPAAPPPPRPVAAEIPTAARSVTAVDQAFSSQTIVTLYPAPVALAYRRFCQESDPRARLDALFAVLEASVRYLVTLGISDLFHCLAESGDDSEAVLKHKVFAFLRQSVPMLHGKWVEALRETARALAGQKAGIIPELPVLCKPGGPFDDLLGDLVAQRNRCVHTEGSVRLPTEACRKELREFRPRLEQALREMQFVCRYPLGFFSPFAGMAGGSGQRYYHLHSCMGAWIGATSRALDLKTTAELQLDFPFVATPDGRRLLYLWPLLLERRSEYTGRRTLWVFQEIPDNRRPFLTTVRAAAIDVPEDWSADLHPEPAASHRWLLDRLRALPPAPAVPRELRLAERLYPTRGGKLLGQETGSNRLLSVVAIGGYGTIYAAEAADGERVAVKVIEGRTSAAQLVRFNQEFEKLRLAAGHPGIIHCYEYGDVDLDGRVCPWYSMEFALGGDLRSRIDKRRGLLKGRLPWDDPATRAEIAREFTAVTEAVAHLHGLHIVHRDIKPGNVLIMEDGSLRLSDFGLVKNLQPSEATLKHGPQTSTGGGAGTPGYMAPEQARGRDVGKTADVYALGILLAELAVGERPKALLPEGDTAAAGSTLKSYKPLKQLPAALRGLIERCTDADPQRRPEDARALLQEFGRLVGSPCG